MQYPSLVSGILIKRYKSLLVDVRLDNGKVVTAYCPTTAPLDALLCEGAKVFLSRRGKSSRRVRYVLEIVVEGATMVALNTTHRLQLIAESIAAKSSLPFSYASLMPTPHTPTILSLMSPEKELLSLMIEPILLKRGTDALFPEFPGLAPRKRLKVLSEQVNSSRRTFLLFLVMRPDCLQMKIAWDIDPLYGADLRKIQDKGVEILCHACSVTPQEITIGRSIPLIF